MTPHIPAGLKAPINQQVLGHLAGLSAHSDVAEALRTALKPLGDVQVFCPDWQQYRFVAAFTMGTLFAFAAGASTVGFRLDERMQARALVCGGAAHPECGGEWISFTLFRDDWPQVDLEFWARKAYVAAREVGR